MPGGGDMLKACGSCLKRVLIRMRFCIAWRHDPHCLRQLLHAIMVPQDCFLQLAVAILRLRAIFWKLALTKRSSRDWRYNIINSYSSLWPSWCCLLFDGGLAPTRTMHPGALTDADFLWFQIWFRSAPTEIWSSSSSASGIDERSPASSNKLANQFAHCVIFKFRKCLCQTSSGKKQHGSIGSIHEIMRYANVLHGSLRFVCIFQRWTNLPKSSGNSSGGSGSQACKLAVVSSIVNGLNNLFG